MNSNLTPKECSLLTELKGQEELCIQKYRRSAEAAVDGQLKGLFTHIADIEQQHYDTLTNIENGNVPQPTAAQQKTPPTFTEIYGTASTPDKDNDSFLCTDTLTMEKHASQLYDTSVFEFRDENTRKALNHIQGEEQEHGKMIYDYMTANHMYG